VPAEIGHDETNPISTHRAQSRNAVWQKPSFSTPVPAPLYCNMNYETKAADLWERTKAWADKNRAISGALVGGAAGTIVPWVGTLIGAIVGAGIGFASSMEKKE